MIDRSIPTRSYAGAPRRFIDFATVPMMAGIMVLDTLVRIPSFQINGLKGLKIMMSNLNFATGISGIRWRTASESSLDWRFQRWDGGFAGFSFPLRKCLRGTREHAEVKPVLKGSDRFERGK